MTTNSLGSFAGLSSVMLLLFGRPLNTACPSLGKQERAAHGVQRLRSLASVRQGFEMDFAWPFGITAARRTRQTLSHGFGPDGRTRDELVCVFAFLYLVPTPICAVRIHPS
jgi:hypothetical protein